MDKFSHYACNSSKRVNFVFKSLLPKTILHVSILQKDFIFLMRPSILIQSPPICCKWLAFSSIHFIFNSTFTKISFVNFIYHRLLNFHRTISLRQTSPYCLSKLRLHVIVHFHLRPHGHDLYLLPEQEQLLSSRARVFLDNYA